MKRSWIKKSSKPLKKRGTSETSVLKEKIQELERKIVIIRDGGCVLRTLQGKSIQGVNIPMCNGYRNDGEMILQADHLITRSNSGTFADTRLIVCLCKGHHGWKSVGSNLRKEQYDTVLKTILPKDRLELWEEWERKKYEPYRMGATDWKMEIVNLECELKDISNAQKTV